MYKSIFSKNNTDDSRTVVESKGITYLPLDFSSKQSEEKETYKNPLEWFFNNLNSFSNANRAGVSYDGYNPRYIDFNLDADIEVDVPDTFSTKEEFKSVMLPLYEQVLTSRGLDPSFARVLVAQDGLETNWGKSTIGNHNYGNITGSSGKNKVVSEYINGVWTTKSQTFVNYDNVTDYINAKIDLLSKPRYDVFSHPVNEFAQRVKDGGYATAPNYVEVLNNTIRTLRKGGVLKFDGGGYLSRNAKQYNKNISNGMPFGHLPTNITKHQIKLANSADNKDHENEIVVRNLSKEIQKIIDKWGDAMFNNGVSYDFNYDTPEGIGLRMLNYYESSGYSPRSTRDTIRFVNDEQMRYTTNGFFDSNGNPVITYNDPNNIYNRYSTGFINDMIQLFYSVSKKRFGGVIKKYNTGGPVSWALSDEWHAPLLPSYVNSKPYASDNVSGFNNAKDVYEYILSLPGSNPAIAAGWTGVFMKESGLDHNAVNKSSGAKGIAQLLGSRRKEYMRWLNGRSDNWQNQISWVWEKVNNGVDDWQVYYDALKDKVDRGIKLSEDEASHWNSMKNSKYRNYSFQNYRDKIGTMDNPGDIAELMTWTFERPGNKEAHIDQRRGYANNVYNQFNYDNNFGQWSWE